MSDLPLHLVIQGPGVTEATADTLRDLSSAQGIEVLGEQAFRLLDAQHHTEVAEYCRARRIDYGYVPATAKLADFRLLAMDMDSTLITIECIDELADMARMKAKVSSVTAAAMRGEIHFAESLRRRVALLEGLPVAALEHVYQERLHLSPGAEALLTRASALGIKTLLVSGGFTYFVDRLKTRLKLDYTRSNVLEVRDGKLTGRVLGHIFDEQGKVAALRETCAELGIATEQAIVLGDGANDLPMMTAAGVSIAYHAKPIVRQQATYALNHCGLDGVLNLFP